MVPDEFMDDEVLRAFDRCSRRLNCIIMHCWDGMFLHPVFFCARNPPESVQVPPHAPPWHSGRRRIFLWLFFPCAISPRSSSAASAGAHGHGEDGRRFASDARRGPRSCGHPVPSFFRLPLPEAQQGGRRRAHLRAHPRLCRGYPLRGLPIPVSSSFRRCLKSGSGASNWPRRGFMWTTTRTSRATWRSTNREANTDGTDRD